VELLQKKGRLFYLILQYKNEPILKTVFAKIELFINTIEGRIVFF
jgi:hypothetical protein